MFAYHQGNQFTYKIWKVDKNDNCVDSRELTRDIVIPRVSDHEPPAKSLLTLQYYKQLQFKTLSTRLKQNTTKMTDKHNRKRAADKASRPGPTQRQQHKAAPWTAKLNDELTLFTDDLTENEEDYEDSLDLASHLIRQPPPSDHNPENVPVSIVTGGEEEEEADYIFNNDDPLSEFDYVKPSIAEVIYNEFSPGREKLNVSMLSIASHRWKDSQLKFKIS